MSLNTRGMIVATISGSVTRRQSTNGQSNSTRIARTDLTAGRNLRDATLRMGRALKRVPREVANRWYGFTRSECRYQQGHLMGAYPDVARAFAADPQNRAPLSDVMAPADELRLELKRNYYLSELPPLEEVEKEEAEAECELRKAEIMHDAQALKEAARKEREVAETLEEVADRVSHGGEK